MGGFQVEPRLCEFCRDALRRETEVGGRPLGRIERAVNNHELAARLQVPDSASEGSDAVRHVVVGIGTEQQIDGFSDGDRRCGRDQPGLKIRQAEPGRALPQVLHHPRFGIEADDRAMGQVLGQPHDEVPGTGSNLGHRGVMGELQAGNDRVRFLPGVTLWRVQPLGDRVDIIEAMMVVMRIVIRRGVVVFHVTEIIT